MNWYKQELIRWLVYCWTEDNPDKYLEVLQVGNIRLAGGSDVIELIGHIREEMLMEFYSDIKEEEIFDAISMNNHLLDVQISEFYSYCSKNNIVDLMGDIKKGWLYKYDQQRQIKPVNPQDNKYV